MTVVAILVVVLLLVFVAGRAMIALALARGPGNVKKPMRGRDSEAMDELHRRVKLLRPREE